MEPDVKVEVENLLSIVSNDAFNTAHHPLSPFAGFPSAMFVVKVVAVVIFLALNYTCPLEQGKEHMCL